jgi:hypothetical protein
MLVDLIADEPVGIIYGKWPPRTPPPSLNMNDDSNLMIIDDVTGLGYRTVASSTDLGTGEFISTNLVLYYEQPDCGAMSRSVLNLESGGSEIDGFYYAT